MGGLVPANPVILAFTTLGEIAGCETAHDPIKMC